MQVLSDKDLGSKNSRECSRNVLIQKYFSVQEKSALFKVNVNHN